MIAASSPLLVSIQSQKGGVGKTSIALHVARLLLTTNNVLFIDFDLTGTEAAKAITSLAEQSFWKNSFHTVTIGGKEANLMDLFNRYMKGYSMPDKATFFNKGKTADDEGMALQFGMINIISSCLSENEGDDGYGPAVLFDSLHSEWFLEMVKELIASCRTAGNGKQLAVIFDNAPGYCGLEPTLEDWLTDLGPTYAKFIYVTSPDNQDRVATSLAIERLKRALKDKKQAAAFFHAQTEETLTRPQRRFFFRLVEAEPEDLLLCTHPKPDKMTHPDCTDCDLCYYLHKIDADTSKNSLLNISIIVNKVPSEIYTGELRETIKNQNPECDHIPLSKENSIPLFNDLIFQFCSDSLMQTKINTDKRYVDIKYTDRKYDEYKSRRINKLRIELKKIHTEYTNIFPKYKLNAPEGIHPLIDLLTKVKSLYDNVSDNMHDDISIDSRADAVDFFGFKKFSEMITLLFFKGQAEQNLYFNLEFSKRAARLLVQDCLALMDHHPYSITNISSESLHACIWIFSLGFGFFDLEKINTLHTPAAKTISLIAAMDTRLKRYSGMSENKNTSPTSAQIQQAFKNLSHALPPSFTRNEDVGSFYSIFNELHNILLNIPEDITFIGEVLQTYAGTPRPLSVYGPAILALTHEVIVARVMNYTNGRRFLHELGMPAIEDEEVHLAPSSFEDFKQGHSLRRFSACLKPIVDSWMASDAPSPSASFKRPPRGKPR